MPSININNTPFLSQMCPSLVIKLYGLLSSRTQNRIREYYPETHRLTELRKRGHNWEVSRGCRLPSITSQLHKGRAALIPFQTDFSIEGRGEGLF